jgi:hypothetical protein
MCMAPFTPGGCSSKRIEKLPGGVSNLLRPVQGLTPITGHQDRPRSYLVARHQVIYFIPLKGMFPDLNVIG